jgi:hypothetical protein
MMGDLGEKGTGSYGIPRGVNVGIRLSTGDFEKHGIDRTVATYRRTTSNGILL